MCRIPGEGVSLYAAGKAARALRVPRRPGNHLHPHAATMAVLAGVSANWRRYALADALIAASLAAAGLACAADAPASDPAAGRLLALRDRWARWLAARLAPGARLRPGRV